MFSNEKHNRMESKPNESNERTRTTESSAAARFQDLAIYPCLPPLYPCILVAGDPHRTEWNRDGAIRRNEKSRKEPCRAAPRTVSTQPPRIILATLSPSLWLGHPGYGRLALPVHTLFFGERESQHIGRI